MAVTIEKNTLWTPYRPSPSQPWNLRRVAHLHRRAGFGASWRELQRDLASGPEAAVERLLDAAPDTPDESELFHALRRGMGPNVVDRDQRLQAYWMNRIVFGRNVLREKLTLFWHGHFATSNVKVRNESWMVQQNETLRKHALGNFHTLVSAMLTDPAMLVWLDGVNSPKAKPNENLARELLELFTLGEGNYSEADIKNAARALTGWVRPTGNASAMMMASEHPFRFRLEQFDDGTKQFLGKTGGWKSDDIIRICLEHPATANFICRKLYRYLVADVDEPPAEMLSQLAEEFRQHDYSIRHVVAIILRSEHFHSSASYRQKVASPVEISAGLVRMLGFPKKQVRLLPIAEACRQQGQHLFFPPNVAGWKGGRNWITSSTLLYRSNWLTDVIWGNDQISLEAFDPDVWIEQNQIPRADAIDALADLLVQRDVSREAMQMARAAARPGDADSLRKAMHILVQCPELQLV